MKDERLFELKEKSDKVEVFDIPAVEYSISIPVFKAKKGKRLNRIYQKYADCIEGFCKNSLTERALKILSEIPENKRKFRFSKYFVSVKTKIDASSDRHICVFREFSVKRGAKTVVRQAYAEMIDKKRLKILPIQAFSAKRGNACGKGCGGFFKNLETQKLSVIINEISDYKICDFCVEKNNKKNIARQ